MDKDIDNSIDINKDILLTNSTSSIDISNLPINSKVSIDKDNLYFTLPVDKLIHQALSYVMYDRAMPTEMKHVLFYYGIIDHFYPASDNELCDDGSSFEEEYAGCDTDRVTAAEIRYYRERGRRFGKSGAKGSNRSLPKGTCT